jgi:nitroimidazol reductase NimA-like FMN-containing flavoprotein (pyridoxamine 5'-phosphate oxidase superfamily)
MAIEFSPQETIEFLESQRTVVVATTRKSGSPVMHAVWFVYLDNAIYINIQRDSFKMKNILRDHRVCALVEDGESYFDLRGVMVEGNAVEVTDDDEILRVQDAQELKHKRIGSGTENLPSYFGKSREERLKRGDRVMVKIPLTSVRTWNFGKSREHYQKS